MAFITKCISVKQLVNNSCVSLYNKISILYAIYRTNVFIFI
jgi:hypothetical protein